MSDRQSELAHQTQLEKTNHISYRGEIPNCPIMSNRTLQTASGYMGQISGARRGQKKSARRKRRKMDNPLASM